MNTQSKPSYISDTNLKETIALYTKHAKWFVLAIVLALIFAFLHLRYATPEYASAGKIEIIEDENSSSELSAFADMKMLTGATNKVEDEIEKLNSRSNFIQVVKDLHLNVKYTLLGNIKDSEIYRKIPIKVNFIASDSVVNNSKAEFLIELKSKTNFVFSEDEDTPPKVYAFGSKVSTEMGDIVITPNLEYFEGYLGSSLKVNITPVFLVAEAYLEKIVIAAASETSNIISITLNDAVQQKGTDIINSLITTYNANAVADKKEIADRTSNFINERILEISSELTDADQTEEDFKSSRGITDIASEANMAMSVGTQSRQELENAKMQLSIASGVKEFVSGETGYEVLPTNIGLSDPTIANTTERYNALVSERNKLLQSADERNPIIVNLDKELDGLKQTMNSSLQGMERNLGMQVNNLSSQVSRMNNIRYSAPKNQRQLTDITRQQQTTESLYLYLLQKREEAQITAASSPSQSDIIDNAYASGTFPVTPKPAITYLAALMIGFLIPFGVIYSKNLLDNKVNNKNGLAELVNNAAPVLAEIPRVSKKDSLLIDKNDRSVLSEAIRILRTNLDYLVKSKKGEKNNIIYVTSSVPGEGKTFLASNLAMVFASTDKKVLLVGADIRNPKLYSFFTGPDVDRIGKKGKERDLGLTDYLYDDSLKVKDIINPLLAHTSTIDIIYSGKIPPNPSELLMSPKFKTLLDEVSEQYDYVIVDTAPLVVVTDTLLISEYANHTIYVTRAGVTENKVIEFPLNLKKEGKLNGLYFVVNDVEDSNLGYGGQYGYGYGKTTKKWWKF